VLAADRNLVDPGPVQLLQLLEPAGRSLLQLGARADHVQVPAVARVEGQRQPEVALARDVPVAHVAQPVVHPLLVLRRRPLDLVVGVEQRLPDLVAGDEPVVDDPEDERRLAAPADRVPVDDPAGLDQHAALAKRVDDRLLGLVRVLALEGPVARQEAPRLVDRREHR
jgi:hypothetical protein